MSTSPAAPRAFTLGDFDFTLPPELIAQHPDDQVLVIAQYLDQIDEVSLSLDLPIVATDTGAMVFA